MKTKTISEEMAQKQNNANLKNQKTYVFSHLCYK